MQTNPKIFNIPANYKFIETFGNWIIENYNQQFSDLKIFLPNQRLCHKLKHYLYQQKFKHFATTQIKALLDINIEDLYEYLPNDNLSKNLNWLAKIKILEPLEAIMLICEQIKFQKIFNIPNFAARFKIAKSLYDLFADIENEQIDLATILKIDDSNLAGHQQFTLDFFISFYSQIKKFLLENNLMFSNEFHHLIINNYIEAINNSKKSPHIIIAGSTGSIKSSRYFIKNIFNSLNGKIFIAGYRQNTQHSPIHPQYFLHELVKFLEIQDSDIIELKPEQFQLSHDDRLKFNDLIFDNYQNFAQSKNLQQNLIAEKINIACQKNIELIEAKNEIQEAQIISEICLNNHHKKIGIICNNNNLLSFLKLSLAKLQLPYNDSFLYPITQNSILINFMLLILKLKFDDFNSHNFLSLLKNPLFYQRHNRDLIDKFEIDIIRQARTDNGLDGLLKKVENTQYQQLVFDILKNLPKDKKFKSLWAAIEYFVNDKIENILSNSIGKTAIYHVFLLLQKIDFTIDNIDDLAVIFNEISYNEKSTQNYNIQLLSPVEARLLNFDIIILCSCTNDDFPKTENHGWIGAKIKNELGVNKTQSKIGQNAFDLYHYLCNDKIIISYSEKRGNNQQVESIFITKIKTLFLLLNINLLTNCQNRQPLNFNKFYLARPNPIVANQYLPGKYYVTDIAKLTNNPYEIYVNKILQLQELKAIDYEESYAEFGSFVHKALENLVTKQTNDDDNSLKEIFNNFFTSQYAQLIWYPKFKNFLPHFLKDNQNYQNQQNICEKLINLQINSISIVGKVDRIVIDNSSNATIIDYKTGLVPRVKQVFNFQEPQLLIYSYILSQSLLSQCLISNLAYWQLNQKPSSKIQVISDNPSEIAQISQQIPNYLRRLFEHFYQKNHGFLATSNQNNDNIVNLSRIQEWQH